MTKADNLGLGLVALGLLPQAGSLLAALKLVIVWVLVLLSGAATSQMIGRALRKELPSEDRASEDGASEDGE